MAIENEFQFQSLSDAAARLADDMADTIKRALELRGHAAIAVSGGRTPELAFPKLATADLDWTKIDVTLIDERRVAVDHADSNEGLARKFLLTGAAAGARFCGLTGELPEIEDNLSRLEWPLDAVFLGVGPDGHIASLFPDSDDWRDAPGRALAVAAAGDRRARVSLTPRALLDCRRIFLILSGPDKRAVFDAAKTPGPVRDLPVRLVLHQDRVPVTVYMAD